MFAQVLDAETGVRLPSVLTEVTLSGHGPRERASGIACPQARHGFQLPERHGFAPRPKDMCL